MKRRFLSLLTIAAMTLTYSSVVNADNTDSSEKVIVQPAKSVDVAESTTIYKPSVANQATKVTTIDVSGIDKESGEITDESQFKKSLLKFFNTNPQKYAKSIEDIDAIVGNIKNKNLNQNANSGSVAQASTLDGEVTPYTIVFEGWSTEPHITLSQDRVTYSTSWVTEDNYRSSVPITVTYTKTLSTNATLGFSGSGLIKSKLGFTASFGVTQTSTIAQGATVPGWTAWGYRPYIKYHLDEWEGIYYYIDSTGGIVQTIEGPVTGSNKTLITKSNEYWSRTNTTQSLTATTPTPPTGVPNV
ncbi:hypothetical protein [Paenibacillus sacheonensis]|uniref:Uncharacterized protein n=1 Tax=Paenibacillus sacheonensis TaxID=742054 RepID=A0A7X5C540_9BACL|nr:hypothetical protein [Paenibacillus sacheonensis]MBM7569163.1 hypothetical protein [Paenibacillus sacheonensis]NBC72994.1 hypothetical protein [Paenibacillus sacheonensis]